MKKGFIAVLSFAAGAIAGAAASWIFAAKKYQKLVDEAVKTVHETAVIEPIADAHQKEETPKQEEPTPEIQVTEEVKPEPAQAEPVVSVSVDKMSLENNFQKQAAKVAREKPDIINYNKMLKDLNYKQDTEENTEEFSEYPYLILGDKIPYGKKNDANGVPYDTITLIYYEDGVVADTSYEIIDDVDRTIGNESLTHFGDFPNKGSIFVRNDRLKTDFEVCMSQLTWEGDILERMPYLRGQP